jgi:hypothetical protein
MKRALLSIFICGHLCSSVAKEISDSDATNAIVGEAAGAPYVVKLGIADALRNRKTLHGVYGFRAAHNAHEPRWAWRDARRAWQQSARVHLTHGATNFGNRHDVQIGTFAGMTLTVVLGTGQNTTYFFKP